MPLIEYRCRYCSKYHKTMNEALDCEKSHLKIVNAKALNYTFGKFPTEIEIMFSNGETRMYISEDCFYYEYTSINEIKNIVNK